MNIDWSDLRTELAEWRAQGLRLPIWWRDDDAVAPTPALSRLTKLSARTGMPVHLAVVPRPATPDLAAFVADNAPLIPVVHGWAHENHALPDAKKSEFGTAVPRARHDIQLTISTARDLFGARLAPMFVPPWNRIAPDLYPDLVSAGFDMVSTFTPRKIVQPVPHLTQINTHLDPIDWRGTRGQIAPDIVIAGLVAQLRDRRAGDADASEPFGLLTHHLVHTEDVWDFTAQFIEEISQGPVDLFRADHRPQ